MIYLIISGLIFVVSGGLFLRLLWRRLPDAKNLDLTSLSIEQTESARVKILQAKWARSSAQMKAKVNVALKPQTVAVGNRLKKWKEKLSALEAKYQHHDKPAEPIKPATVSELFDGAEAAINEQDFPLAEKKLIEVIAQDRKNIRAYEMLGDLYSAMKNYHQAEEIFKYLLKLHFVTTRKDKEIMALAAKNGQLDEAENELLSSLNVDPKVAGYYESLAEVYELMGQDEKALDNYLKATSIEPNNPRLLDKLLRASVRIKDKDLARSTFRRLKVINPENGKLAELQASIEKIS